MQPGENDADSEIPLPPPEFEGAAAPGAFPRANAGLKPGGKVVTTSGVKDGPFVEAKEIVGGYMIITADSYEEAAEVSKGILMPGASIEIRELGAN